jgi:hypothetical protein
VDGDAFNATALARDSIEAMPKHSSHILELAKRGAEVRLRELAGEAKTLLAAFPDLRKSFDRDELPVDFLIRQGAVGQLRNVVFVAACPRRSGRPSVSG